PRERGAAARRVWVVFRRAWRQLVLSRGVLRPVRQCRGELHAGARRGAGDVDARRAVPAAGAGGGAGWRALAGVPWASGGCAGGAVEPDRAAAVRYARAGFAGNGRRGRSAARLIAVRVVAGPLQQ